MRGRKRGREREKGRDGERGEIESDREYIVICINKAAYAVP